jgi:hypothetical protein
MQEGLSAFEQENVRARAGGSHLMWIGLKLQGSTIARLASVGNLLSLYIAAIVGFCGLAFLGISAIQQPTQKVSTESSDENDNPSRQLAECVFAALRDQEAARQADRERFISEMRGTTIAQLQMMESMMPRPPSAAEIEIARNQNLIRIKELCRLKISSSNQ